MIKLRPWIISKVFGYDYLALAAMNLVAYTVYIFYFMY